MTEANGHERNLAVQFGRKRIEYRLRYSARSTLAIDVHPDLSVVVTAPKGSDDLVVERRVKKRAAWIVQQQRFFETYLPRIPPRRYVSGESFRYLGRQYRLRVVEGGVETGAMSRGQIVVTLLDVSKKERVRPLVTRWYRQRAETVSGALFEEMAAQAIRHEIQGGIHRIQVMRTRWGSCTRDGLILLNPELVVAPKACIEYVIAHELCHLKEHNHGRAFFRLLTAMMPDWEERGAAQPMPVGLMGTVSEPFRQLSEAEDKFSN